MAPPRGWACRGAVPWSRARVVWRLRSPLSRARARAEPSVAPLLEPRRTQPVRRSPGRHVSFAELVHVFVEDLTAAHERHQAVLRLSPVFGGEPPQRRRCLPGKGLAQQPTELPGLATLKLPKLRFHEQLPGGTLGPGLLLFPLSLQHVVRRACVPFAGVLREVLGRPVVKVHDTLLPLEWDPRNKRAALRPGGSSVKTKPTFCCPPIIPRRPGRAEVATLAGQAPGLGGAPGADQHESGEQGYPEEPRKGGKEREEEVKERQEGCQEAHQGQPPRHH